MTTPVTFPQLSLRRCHVHQSFGNMSFNCKGPGPMKHLRKFAGIYGCGPTCTSTKTRTLLARGQTQDRKTSSTVSRWSSIEARQNTPWPAEPWRSLCRMLETSAGVADYCHCLRTTSCLSTRAVMIEQKGGNWRGRGSCRGYGRWSASRAVEMMMVFKKVSIWFILAKV